MLSFYSKGASYNKILNHFIVERNIKCYFQEGFAITSDAFPLELWESEEGYCTLLVENRRKLLVVESFVVLKINMIIYHYYWVLKGFREKKSGGVRYGQTCPNNVVCTSLQTSNDLGTFIGKYASINTKLNRPQSIRWFTPFILKIFLW